MKATLYRNIVILVYVLLLPLVGFAQRAGDLDTTFNPEIGANDWVQTTTVQADGKIIIGGYFTSFNGTSRRYIARLNADGSLDATFNPSTGANGIVNTIALQADGKIIIGGSFTSFNGTTRNRIACLNTDGSLDATFSPSTGANDWVRTNAVQNDGKIIIGGDFTSFNGTTRNYIARLNANGSLDASFNSGTRASGEVLTTTLQADGKIIIGGGFTSFNGTTRNYIARLNTDGSLDATFNRGTGANDIVRTTALQADGKIIIGGDFTSFNGTTVNYIARLNANGSLDASFNPGTGANDWVLTTALQADGKIIIGGDFTTFDGSTRNRIARLNADGSLDASFNPGTGANDWVLTTAVQSDGKIIIGGWFFGYNGHSTPFIVRVHGSTITSAKKSINSPQLNLYPNPTTGIVTLTTNTDTESITITNTIGQLVFTTKAQSEMELNLSHLASGVYMVQVLSNKGVSTQRLVIQ